MKIGIVGPAERAVAWENHLRAHQSVSEVTIAPSVKNVHPVDACILVDQSQNRLDHLLKAVKLGLHTFLVGPLPTDSDIIEKIYYASEEANVLLQFSHWPSLAPASKWTAKKITKPTFIQIVRELNYNHRLESDSDFKFLWIDELAFCLRWIKGTVHYIDLKTVELGSADTHLMHLFLRFDSGATANIYVSGTALTDSHHRIIADNNFISDCNVLEQSVRLGQKKEGEHLFFNTQSFDASKSAELSALEFIKSIQLKRPTIYNGYHLMELTKTLDKIDKRLRRR